MRRTKFGSLWQWTMLVALVLASAAVAHQSAAIIDWAELRTYTPPPAIAAIAQDTAMTPLGKHWFYLNRPQLDNKADFNVHCGSLQSSGEQSAVLGCFTGDRHGIYLYDVTDPRLNGVVQVTAAHEMLHQAYARLSDTDKAHVNAMLQDYARHLTDQTVKDQLAIYQKSEPGELLNEMHSLFGTEIANLPAPLEHYYARYFSDRARVVAFNAQYQAVFVAQTKQINDDDAQLGALKKTIDVEQADLQAKFQALQEQRRQLSGLNQTSSAYEVAATAYNGQVNAYNSELVTAQQDIAQYNQLVDARNAIAVQERQLQSSLSSQLTPVGQ